MQILKTIVHETVWGGKKLTPYSASNCEKIGHLYSCIDTKSMKSLIIHGTFEGRSIHDWFLSNKAKYGLAKYEEFPVLMALVEAADNLSIQVHPDDEMARRIAQKPFGKNESFFILEAPTEGFMYNGCKAKSHEEMAQLIAEGRCLEGVDHLPVKRGDYVYVTGGTLHAASRGSLSFEIEENCDATYRFYDFDRLDKNGRKRPLQVDNALACLKLKNKSEVRNYEPGKQIVERMYSTQYIVDTTEFQNNEKRFVIAVLLKGEKKIKNIYLMPGSAIIVEPNDCIDLSDCEWMLVRLI